MKIHLILVAMMFILIAGFAFGGANKTMANTLHKEKPNLSTFETPLDEVTNSLRTHNVELVQPSDGIFQVDIGVGMPVPDLVLTFKFIDYGRWDLGPKNDLAHSTGLTFDKFTGIGQPGQTDSVRISINNLGLLGSQPGNYSLELYLVSGGDITIRINIHVIQGVVATPGHLTYQLTDGEVNPSQSLTIQAPNNSAVAWNATTNASWISLSRTSGTTPTTIQVSINANAASLNPGDNDAFITFRYPNTNYPEYVADVELTVKKDKLFPGETLTLGRFLLSQNREYKLIMKFDGNLVLYRTSDNFAMWASGTNGQGANQCIMQADGNLVIYNQGGQLLWTSVTDGNPGAFLKVQDDRKVIIQKSSTNSTPIWSTAELCSGRTLQSGKILRSGNGKYKLEMQTDGNLVLRILNTSSEQIVWASNSYGNPGSRVEMQVDGNLVIRTPNDQIIWASNTYTVPVFNNNGSTLKVQDDGNLVIYRPNGAPIWNRTQGRLY